MITLTNNFHHTTYTLRANYGEALSPSQIRRARKALCGVQGCTCGGNLGERGPNNPVVEPLGYNSDGMKCDEKKCSSCGVNSATERHACPFAEEVEGDFNPEYCDCCADCQRQCLMDI